MERLDACAGGAGSTRRAEPTGDGKGAATVVKDTLIDGLWGLARAARARFNGPVIGLTGSAGKTSTKEFLAAYPNAYASPSSFITASAAITKPNAVRMQANPAACNSGPSMLSTQSSTTITL